MNGMQAGMQPNMMAQTGLTPQNLRFWLTAQFNRQPPSQLPDLSVADRAGYISDIVTAVRLAKEHMPFNNVVRWAMQLEQGRQQASPSKGHYVNCIQELLMQLRGLRQQNLNAMGNNPMVNGGRPAMLHNVQQPQVAPQNQQFAHLTQPMQPTPIPSAAQPNQAAMGMPNQAMQAAQMLQQRSQQSQQQQPQSQRPPLQQYANAQLGDLQGQKLTPEESKLITSMGHKGQQAAGPEDIERLSREWGRLSAEVRSKADNNLNKFIEYRFRQNAFQMYMRRKTLAVSGAAQQGNPNPSPMPGQQNPHFQQRPRTPVMNGQGGVDMTSLVEQQANALRSQERGSLVVPASNNPNGISPQIAQLMGMSMQNVQTPQMPNAMPMQNGLRPGQNMQQPPNQQQQQQQLNHQAQVQLQRIAAMQRQQAGAMGAQFPQQNAANMSLLTQPLGQQGVQQPGMLQQTPTQGQLDQQTMQMLQQPQQRTPAQAHARPQPMPRQIPPDIAGMLPEHVKASMQVLGEQEYNDLIVKVRQNIQQAQNRPLQPQGMPAAAFNMTDQMGGQGMMASNQMQMPQNFQNNGMGQGVQQQQPGQEDALQATTQRMIQPRNLQPQQLAAMPGHGVPTTPNIPPQLLAELEHKVFPPAILNGRVNIAVPEHVKTWGQLKAWMRVNPDGLTIDVAALGKLQMLLLQNHLSRQRSNAANPLGAQMPPGAGNQPGGPAPAAQMVAPGLGGQPQMTQLPPGMAPPTVTADEVARCRAALLAKGQNVSDDEAFKRLQEFKVAQAIRRMQQQQAAQQAQQAQQQQNNAVQQQQRLQAMNQQANMGQPQMAQQPPGMAQPPMPVLTPRQPQATPKLLPTPQHVPTPMSQAPQPTSQTPQNLPPQITRQGDEVVEMPNPMAASNPQMLLQQQQALAHLSPDVFASLTPQQQRALASGQVLAPNVQAQLENMQRMKNSQQQPQPQAIGRSISEVEARLLAMTQQLERTTPRAQPIAISPQDRDRMTQTVQQHWKSLFALLKVVRWMLRSGENDAQVQNVLRTRLMIVRQLVSEQNPTIASQVTMSPDYFTVLLHKLAIFAAQKATELMANARQQQQLQQKVQLQQQQQQPQQTSAMTLPQQPHHVPVSQKQAPQPPLQPEVPRASGNKRNVSKPPPAPTDTHAPFSFGHQQSPHGTPVYAVNSASIDLKLPTLKKARTKATASVAATPAPTMPTPGPGPSPRTESKAGAGKKSSQTAPTPPPVRPAALPQKEVFPCQSMGCERSVPGFGTQAELEAHARDVHMPPEDPVAWTIDKVRNALDLDENGLPKTKAAAVGGGEKKDAKGKSMSAPMSKAGSSQGKAAASPAKTPSAAGAGKGDGAAKSDAEDETAADMEKEFNDVLGNVGILEEMSAWEAENDFFANTGDDLFGDDPPAADDAAAATDPNDTSKWDWYSKMTGTTAWFDVVPADSSKAGSTPPLDSSPSSVGITPAGSSNGKKSPDLNGNGKRGRDVDEEDELALRLTISDDTDDGLESLMDQWNTGDGPMLMKADGTMGKAPLGGVVEFGNFKVGNDLLNAMAAEGGARGDFDDDAFMDDIPGDYEVIPGWETTR